MKNLEDVVAILTPLEKEFKSELDEIGIEVDNFGKTKAKLSEEGRNLSISIVGAVKSGKSSLLNALLFDGESVLPKAATPMTAALTYIRYAPECSAEVEFFSEKEWDRMETFAREFDKAYADSEAKLREEDALAVKRGGPRREITRDRVIKHSRGKLTEEYVAAKELVDSVRRSGLDVSRYLKKGDADCVRITADSPEELVGKMGEYVGAQGKFTPIVCATTIYLNDPRLEGYEIVDTPGTNDPVIFRGARTSASLGRTDAVLAVSTASQFFQQSDLELLSDLLPRKGINNFLLVASQYDRTVGEVEDEIDDDLEGSERLDAASRHVADTLSRNYEKRIRDIAAAAAKNNDGDRWAKLVEARPVCVSSLAYALARHWGKWTEDERKSLAKFNELVEDYEFPDAPALLKFSNIDAVSAQLDGVKARKAQIIAASLEQKTVGFRSAIADKLATLKDRIGGRITTLENEDVASLRKKLKQQTSAVKAGEELIKSTFEEFRFSAQSALKELVSTMRSARNSYSKLNVRTETEAEEYTVDKGCGVLWWRCWTGTRYETRTRTIRTRYANTYDAVNQVEAFVDEIRKELEATMERVIDRKTLKRQVTEVVMEIFEKAAGDDLDLQLLKAQLQTAVNKIEIPDTDFGNLDYTRMITDSFEGGEVRDDSVDKLQRCHHEAINKVLQDLERKVGEKGKEVEQSLRTAGAEFAERLIAELQEDADKGIAELKDKEASLKRLKSYLPPVEDALAICK